MNQFIEKYDENAIYDTNRINMAIKNQFVSNCSFSSNNNCEILDVDSGELMKVLTSDNDFVQNYSSIKRKENINMEFTELPQQKKFDLLIKNFFYLKTEKENIYNEYLNTKRDLDEQLRKQEIINDEKLEKYKQESYKFKCLYEELNSKYDVLNEKNKELLKKNEEITSKFDRLKEKNNEKENLFVKLNLERNLIESKYEKLSKQVNDDFNNINNLLENEKKEKEILKQDMQVLFRKNEEFKIKYEELLVQNQELAERNKKLEILSKIDKKTLQEYGTIQNFEGMPLDQIYMTSSSIIVPEYKDDKRRAEENFTVQMEVNIAKINKNSANSIYNINQTNIVQGTATTGTTTLKKEKEDSDTFAQRKISEESQQNKTSSYIANLLEDQNNVIQILSYSENDTSEIQHTENSVYSQENEGDNNSNNYSSGLVMYESINYDTLRKYKPRFNPYETEENNYNSIKGENYSSSVSGIFKN